MSQQREIVVVEHEVGCPLDRFADWLVDVDVRMVRPYLGDPVPESVRDGLIVLGGEMSAYDDEVAPWLPAVRDLLRTVVREEVPTLGICLGAQLLAIAAGGDVLVAAPGGRESGVIDVRWRAEAVADPLVSGLPDPTAGPSMHADAIVRLPDDAVWLGASSAYPHQAFRLGTAAWGVQFHPEVSLRTFRGWAVDLPEVDTEAVTAEFLDRDADTVACGRALAERFGTIVNAAVPKAEPQPLS
jgi:GMP synthase (glutamine-hydrolysing)